MCISESVTIIYDINKVKEKRKYLTNKEKHLQNYVIIDNKIIGRNE